mgnify:CR=1 FL=1
MGDHRMDALKPPHGRARLGQVRNGLWMPATLWHKNLVLYEWAAIVGKLLAQGLATHRLSFMYIEYANVAGEGDQVAIPNFGRDNGSEYYSGLSTSSIVDYLRVPVAAATLESADTVNFPKGNLLRIFAQTSGTKGVHGKPFSANDNSKVYGAALVAGVGGKDDASQDLIFSRLYFGTAEQQLKLETSQVGVEWELELQ